MNYEQNERSLLQKDDSFSKFALDFMLQDPRLLGQNWVIVHLVGHLSTRKNWENRRLLHTNKTYAFTVYPNLQCSSMNLLLYLARYRTGATGRTIGAAIPVIT